MLARAVIATTLVAVLAHGARADNGRLLADDTFTVHEGGDLVLDAGLLVALPAALQTGMSTGLAAGITHNCGCHFAYGARVSWSSATESSVPSVDIRTASWTVSQSDLRLRAIGAVRHVVGRGTIALRLGLGATIVHEVRDRNQGARAGNAMETRGFSTLPAADLDAVVTVGVFGPWQLVASGGPTVDVFGGSLHGGWTAELGVAWQP